MNLKNVAVKSEKPGGGVFEKTDLGVKQRMTEDIFYIFLLCNEKDDHAIHRAVRVARDTEMSDTLFPLFEVRGNHVGF